MNSRNRKDVFLSCEKKRNRLKDSREDQDERGQRDKEIGGEERSYFYFCLIRTSHAMDLPILDQATVKWL